MEASAHTTTARVHTVRSMDLRRGRGRRPRGGLLGPSSRRFVRHYIEMVVAMFLGMAVLGPPAGWALGALGSSWSALTEDAPAVMFLLMATAMTAPMVGWMVHRGHSWRANTEMAAAMYVPTFAVIGVLGAGWLTDLGTLMVIEHVAMLLSMLGAMLLRPAEYGHHVHATPVLADARTRLDPRTPR